MRPRRRHACARGPARGSPPPRPPRPLLARPCPPPTRTSSRLRPSRRSPPRRGGGGTAPRSRAPWRRSCFRGRGEELAGSLELRLATVELAVQLAAADLRQHLADARRLLEAERGQVRAADLELHVAEAREVVPQLLSPLVSERQQRGIRREGVRERDDLGRVQALAAQALGDPGRDGDRADDAVDVSPPHLEPFEPHIGLVRGQLAPEDGQPDPPRGHFDAELLAEGERALEEPSRLLVSPEMRVDRTVGAQLAEPHDAAGRSRILEKRLQLVAEPRRGEVADEPHLDAPAGEPCRVLLQAKPVARLVPDAAEDPRRVVDEREVVEDAEDARLQVGTSAEGIGEPPEVRLLERHGHRVDREVPPEEILAQPGPLDRRERARRVVELGARRDDVDAAAASILDDRRSELRVRRDAPSQRLRERARELDRVSLDRDVDVEALLAEQDV